MEFDFKINKLNKVLLDTKIIETGIPEKADVGSVCYSINDSWWTYDKYLLSQGQGVYAEFQNNLTMYSQTTQLQTLRGLRPIITIKPDPEIKKGELILVGERWLFRMISNVHALCCTVVEYCPFNNEPCTRMEDSLLVERLSKWYNNIKDLPVYAVYTEEAHHLTLRSENIFLPSISIGAFFVEAPYPLWTRGIHDEFTGKCLVKRGDMRTTEFCRTKTAAGEYINICPCITIRADSGLKQNDIFCCDGRMFKVVYAEEAVCMNTVGVSCFSTGFLDYTDTETLNEFKKSSEAYAVLMDWAEKTKL